MSTINDGGPAFPSQELNHDRSPYYLNQGMSLRAYAAIAAMQGMMSTPDDQRYGDRADQALSVEQWQDWCVSGLVEHAVRTADALIAELAKVRP